MCRSRVILYFLLVLVNSPERREHGEIAPATQVVLLPVQRSHQQTTFLPSTCAQVKTAVGTGINEIQNLTGKVPSDQRIDGPLLISRIEQYVWER